MTKSNEQSFEDTFNTLKAAWEEVLVLIGNKEDWKNWLYENGHTGKGYSYSQICKALSKLQYYYSIRNSENFDLEPEEEIARYISKSKEIIDFLNKHVLGRNKDYDYFWYLYFLQITPPGDADKKPKIARTVLKISDEREEAYLENLKDAKSEDYHGKFEEVGTSGVYSFSLYNSRKSRKLYFKVYFPNTKYDIVVGSFTTFDLENIYSGRLVLEKIKKDDGIKPPILLGEDVKMGFDDHIKPEVQSFLSKRDKNYLLISNSNGKLSGLNAKIKDEGAFRHIERRFFDGEQPKLFLASPFLAANKTNGQNLLIQMQTDLQTKYKNLKVNINEQNRSYDDTKNGSINIINTESFQKLEETRYFIIILDETKIASFSLVELGFALAKCKYILVLYKKGTVSPKIKELKLLETRHIKVESFSNAATESHSEIMNSIDKFLDEFS